MAWGLLEVLGFLAVQFGWAPLIIRGATIVLGTGLFVVITLAWHHGGRGRQAVKPGELLLLALIAGSGMTLTFILAPDGSTSRPIAAGPVTRLTVTLPRDQRLAVRGTAGRPLAISPDGTRMAYVARTPDGASLAVRAFDSFEAVVLPGTDDAVHPFFSPDGQWVAFFAAGRLQKVPVDGGAPTTITATPSRSYGASWGDDGRIIYSLGHQGLWLVHSDGGEPKLLAAAQTPGSMAATDNPANLFTQGIPIWPSMLPDNEHAIAVDWDGAFLINLSSGAITRLFKSSNQAVYVASGHILYTETGERVRAVPFDLDSLSISGPSIPVADDIFRAPGGGAVLFDVSRNGTFVSVSGGFERKLVVSDRFGRFTPLSTDKRGFRFPRISPDGKYVAVTVDPRPSSIWLYDIERGTGVPLTNDDEHNLTPVWGGESDRLYFVRSSDIVFVDPFNPDEISTIYSFRDNDRIVIYTFSMSLSANAIFGVHIDPDTLNDIYAATLSGGSTAVPVASSTARELTPNISHDGRWLALVSDVTGRDEVYVQPYPGPGPRIRVSLDGGKDPIWSRNGSELYFRWFDRINSVRITGTDPVSFATPEFLFRAELDMTQERNWDVGPDDLFVLVESDPTTTSEFQIVTNWFGVLAERANP